MYSVTSGVIPAPLKVVIYGPEGIGKSTFASKFPDPVFIDTEDGTGKLDVKRLPRPTSWSMLLDEVSEVLKGSVPCATLVVDTADWTEQLCIRHVCDKAKVNGIEDFGYGKGYTYAKEEFGRLLNLLTDVKNGGRNVVVTAHAQISKFEQPDEMGAYDRWSMKTSKQVAPLLREWCDMLLFANYKTIVIKDGDGKNATNKAQGGRRMMYTSHHACWDAKNRDDLPDELPFDYSSIASIVSAQKPAAPATAAVVETAEQMKMASPFRAAKPFEPPAKIEKHTEPVTADIGEIYDGIQENLRELMAANQIEPQELQWVVGDRGYFPPDMPAREYPKDFVDGCLVAAWPQVLEMIKSRRLPDDLPF